MSPYPGERSVLVMDNASIHHNEELVELIESGGAKVVFLPPYSPDFNPIEEAFSAIKAWLCRNRDFVMSFQNPIHVVVEISEHYILHNKEQHLTNSKKGRKVCPGKLNSLK